MHARSRRTALLFAACALSAALAAPLAARAQATEAERTALARSLFREGVDLASQERYADAAERFRRVRALQPTSGVNFNLAAALARTGELVEASELLREVLADTEASRQLVAQAREVLSDVEARMAHLTVRVDGPMETVSLFMDGVTLATVAVDVAIPTNPGTHLLEARRGGEVVSREEVELGEGASREVTLVVPPPSVAEAPEPATEPLREEPPAEPEEGGSIMSSWWLWTGVAILVAGGVAAGLYFGGVFDAPDPVTGNTTPGVLEWD